MIFTRTHKMGSFFVGTTDLKFKSLCMLLCVKKVSALLTMNNFSSIGGEMDEDIPHNVGNYELKKRYSPHIFKIS